MKTLLINAIRDDERTTFQIRETGSSYSVIWYNELIVETSNELGARDAVECIMKDNGWHLEELVQNDDNYWAAITFEPSDSDSVIVTTYEWMGGRYVQLGPKERYSVKCAQEEYGYC